MKYIQQDNSVIGNGKRYTLPSNHDAETLCKTLNTYEKQLKHIQQLTAIKMDIEILKADINQIIEELQ